MPLCSYPWTESGGGKDTAASAYPLSGTYLTAEEEKETGKSGKGILDMHLSTIGKQDFASAFEPNYRLTLSVDPNVVYIVVQL